MRRGGARLGGNRGDGAESVRGSGAVGYGAMAAGVGIGGSEDDCD